MKIKFNKYVIITKERPIEFIDSDCNTTNYIEDAMLNDSEEIAKNVLGTFDRPEEYEVLTGFFGHQKVERGRKSKSSSYLLNS